MALEVISIPVLNRTADEESEVAGVMGGQKSKLKYAAVRALPGRGDYAFRVKPLQDNEMPDVLEWPSARNHYALIVRTHPPRMVPFVHGFEIQAGLSAQLAAAVFRGASGESPGDGARTNAPLPKFSLSVSTQPTGAVVYIDELLSHDEKGPRRTPCAIPVRQGLHSVRVSLFGYLDVADSNRNVTADDLVQWRLPPDPRVACRTLSVSAKGKWTSSGIKAMKGARVVIEVDGQWSCGSKKEMCGPEGYPINEEFAHYYLSPQAGPRQSKALSYGALLMRIGTDGEPRAIGRSLNTTAPSEGVLYFDINEVDNAKARSDNAGSLDVKLTVLQPR